MSDIKNKSCERPEREPETASSRPESTSSSFRPKDEHVNATQRDQGSSTARKFERAFRCEVKWKRATGELLDYFRSLTVEEREALPLEQILSAYRNNPEKRRNDRLSFDSISHEGAEVALWGVQLERMSAERSVNEAEFMQVSGLARSGRSFAGAIAPSALDAVEEWLEAVVRRYGDTPLNRRTAREHLAIGEFQGNGSKPKSWLAGRYGVTPGAVSHRLRPIDTAIREQTGMSLEKVREALNGLRTLRRGT